MTDSTDKKGPMRGSPRLRKWLDSTAADEFKQTGRRPSIAQLLDRLLDAGLASDKPLLRESPPPALPSLYDPEHRILHDHLEEILKDGTPEDRVGIVSNLQWAVTTIHHRRKKRQKAAG